MAFDLYLCTTKGFVATGIAVPTEWPLGYLPYLLDGFLHYLDHSGDGEAESCQKFVQLYRPSGGLTLLLMLVKLPAFVAFYHLFDLLLGGKGGLLSSLKVAVYPATPAILFGWVPYSDFIFGLWVGFFLVPALHYLHGVSWGRSIAFVTLLLGIQTLYVVLTGGGWLIEP